MPDPAGTFRTSLGTGRLDPALLAAFPEQDADDRATGDAWISIVDSLVASQVDPDALDLTRELPDDLLNTLRDNGFLGMAFGTELGGAGLSAYNVFRVIETAAARSVPVGQIMAIQAGVGAGALYPALPGGPVRDLVRARILAGAISGFGDTDAAGQNNRLPRMTATRTEDGTGYLLHGEKLFTGNGPIADLLPVSATLDGQVCVCFVDTASPGFAVDSRVEFMGSRGLPNAALRFDGVRVPREHVLAGADGQLRLPPMINSIAFLGRIYFTGAPAMAIARNCLDWSRDFVNRRTIDGRPLGDYDGIQRIVSAAMSDVYAMDSLVRWCLLDSGITDRWLERFVAKNVLTRTAWRLADRTVSLMGAEGFETVGSKRSRGGVPLPVERALRDARGLRIAGNVDFQLDAQVMRLLLQGWYGADRPVLDAAAADPAGLDLTPANLDHLAAVSGQVRRFAELCAGVTRRRRDPQAPLADERFLVLTGRLAAELVTAAAVLGRTARLGTDEAQDLAGLHCAAARHRLAGLWRELDHTDHPDHRKASRAWLSGSGFQFLTGGGHDHH